MMPELLVTAAALLVIALIAIVVFTRRTTRWGATPEECSMQMPGDEYFTGDPRAFVAMTRAVTINAPPETVWPWLAQMGRGAGWYSVDRLDNGGKTSARHIVSWIPTPREGDASAIGYVRRVIPGQFDAPGRGHQPESRERRLAARDKDVRGRGGRHAEHRARGLPVHRRRHGPSAAPRHQGASRAAWSAHRRSRSPGDGGTGSVPTLRGGVRLGRAGWCLGKGARRALAPRCGRSWADSDPSVTGRSTPSTLVGGEVSS